MQVEAEWEFGILHWGWWSCVSAGRAEGEDSTHVFTPRSPLGPGPEQMVSVFPGRFVTEPQKAPALTRSQTVKAVTGKSRGRTRERWRAEEGEGRARRKGIKSQHKITMDNQHSASPQPFLKTPSQDKNLGWRLEAVWRQLWEPSVRRACDSSEFWWPMVSCVNIH